DKQRGRSKRNGKVPDDRIVERSLHSCSYTIAESETHSHQRCLDQDRGADEHECFLSPQSQRTATAAMFGKLPRAPVNANHHQQQAEEIIQRLARMAGALDCSNLSEHCRRNGIAFARHDLVTLQRDFYWLDAAGFEFSR